MRAKGINYDTGFMHKGSTSRPTFDLAVVRREMLIIRDDLHCNAVRVTGGDVTRLEQAAQIAAEAGLEVWFSPFTCNLDADEMLDLLADCAQRAERLRIGGAEVVLVLGAEISLLNNGFLPGATLDERIKLLFAPKRLGAVLPQVPPLVNDFLRRAVAVVRERFGGKITYASMPFERVDWTPFDLVSVDFYRTAEIAEVFPAAVRAMVAQGKPLAITEFGATTYTGSADAGAHSLEVVVWDTDTAVPIGLNGTYSRDEQEQAQYVGELLAVFDAEGVDSTFVFTFVQEQLPHRDDPQNDLDLGAFSIVKTYEGRYGTTYPDMRWEPKRVFRTVADAYRA